MPTTDSSEWTGRYPRERGLMLRVEPKAAPPLRAAKRRRSEASVQRMVGTALSLLALLLIATIVAGGAR